MALAKDSSTSADRARVVDTVAPGKVIYRSNFDDGNFDGWVDHWSGLPARPMPIVSLTSEMQLRGSHCMMLSTGEEASPVAGDPANAPAVFKRLYRHDEYRYHHLSAWLALGIGGFAGSASSITVMMDTNKLDNSHRSFFQLVADLLRPGPAFCRWTIANDAATFSTVAGTDGYLIGNNENKQGFEFIRLTVDLAANSNLGGYSQFQIGNTVFDLTTSGGGSANTAPQFDGTNPMSDFRGGFNLGFGVSRNQAVVGGCQLFIDDVVYSASNTLVSP